MLRKAEEAELAGRDIGEVGYEGEPMDTETAKTGAPMAAVEDESAGIAENARQTTQADNEQPEVSQMRDIHLSLLFGIKSIVANNIAARHIKRNASAGGW